MSKNKKEKAEQAIKKSSQESESNTLLDFSDSPSSEVLEELEKAGVDPKLVKMVGIKITRQLSHSGPLPPAEQFRLYEETCPGAGERILVWADNEQTHRHAIDKKMSSAMVDETTRGQLMGFVIMASLVLASFVCVFLDELLFAGLFLAGSSLGIVRKFIDGASRKDKN
ncbi:MAG: hypothetical protein COA45_07580 [Zetaproteobacteria bacterium]|nr:MAG: hypothetical protein COA45_07580 [Zetaproteobacteria bacterium]